MSDGYYAKAKQGCAILVFHFLLYCGGCAVFLIIGLSRAASHVDLSSASGIMATAGAFLILLPAWILFTVVWIMTAVFVRRIRKTQMNRAKLEKHVDGSGISPSDFQAIIGEGRGKIATMRSVAQRVTNTVVGDKIRTVADTASRIYDSLEKTPSALKRAKQFLNYYNDAALAIIKNYELLACGDQTEKISLTLNEIESSLDTINESFKKQHSKLLDGSLTEIEVELSLLKKTLQSEGF